MKVNKSVLATFLESVNETAPDLSVKSRNIEAYRTWVEIEKLGTNNYQEGSQSKTMRSISFLAYSHVKEKVKPSTLVKINGVLYSNLELVPIIGNRTKVMIKGWA